LPHTPAHHRILPSLVACHLLLSWAKLSLSLPTTCVSHGCQTIHRTALALVVGSCSLAYISDKGKFTGGECGIIMPKSLN
ncbi:hypothetical protein B566_EDAN008812, partial [Ephemera danica]